MTSTANQAAVIVLNWNGLEDTVECVESLLQQTCADFQLYLADNGSDGDHAHLLTRYSDENRVTLISFPENLGFANGVNRVLDSHINLNRYRWLVLLNNDAVADPEWLANLIETGESEEADLVSSCMVTRTNPDRMDNAGHLFLNTGEVLPRGAGESITRYVDPTEVEGACGGGCLINPRVITRLGLFDPYFSTGYEDAEFGLRVMLAGGTIRYAPHAVLVHRVSASIDRVRDREYAISLQTNIYYTYFKLMPGPVIALNLPFMAMRAFLLPVAALFLGRWRLAQVQWIAHVRLPDVMAHALRSRRNVRRLRTLGSIAVLRRQRFFLAVYWRYFMRFVLRREKTVFEK